MSSSGWPGYAAEVLLNNDLEPARFAGAGSQLNTRKVQMNLHEYQAKELLAKYGLPVQQGILANTLKKPPTLSAVWLANLP